MRAMVKDSFNVSGQVAIEYGATGVVVIYSPFGGEEPPLPGNRVLVVKPDGWIRTALIGEVKLAEDAPGFFIRGLEKRDVPVGTRLWWGKDVSAAFLEKMELALVG
jgi:hypothetical protein